ncbi:MAG: hypothetical protein E7396_06315 [Ruminococcaceae bacterium]|nr:hypothetical protein [Oscillospiraceae bacterium]
MHYTEIAIAKPFEGKPQINMPDLFGASPNKPVILRIPVTGQRPITYSVKNLPDGLTLNNNIITGKVKEKGEYKVIFIAENTLGADEKEVIFEIKENNVLLTPLMGFTSWNAFGPDVSQEKQEAIAKKMVESGIAEYGYSYINTDSGWQKEYGGEFDAIMPSEKFPDMKKMTDTIHSYGLKCGIYSTPMLTAWGCPKELKSIPGCTQGEADDMFSDTNGGIGKIRKEKNNVAQWTKWGFDYLKYDWKPCDPYNAEMMRRELVKSQRDFGFCVSVTARPEYIGYWSKYCNSYRQNWDSMGYWDNFMLIFNTYKDFINTMKKGHFYDLDMLDIGTCELEEVRRSFTEDEQIMAYSLRAFMGSPIQISSTLENLTEFELSIYCNPEIIKINQDTLFSPARPYYICESGRTKIHIYKRKLSDGSDAYAVFNLGDIRELTKIYLDKKCTIRDVWANKDIGETDIISQRLEPHTVKIFKVK